MKLFEVHVNHPDKEDLIQISLNGGTSTIHITPEQAREFASDILCAAKKARDERWFYEIRKNFMK